MYIIKFFIKYIFILYIFRVINIYDFCYTKNIEMTYIFETEWALNIARGAIRPRLWRSPTRLAPLVLHPLS